MKLLALLTLSFSALSLAAPVEIEAAPVEKRDHIVATLFPNYLVPIKQAFPNTPFGTQYTGNITWNSPAAGDEVVLLVGFDVPNNNAAKCALKFTLATGAPWSSTGIVKVNYYRLATLIQLSSTWNNRPARLSPFSSGQIQVNNLGGDATVTGTIPCVKGARMDFEFIMARNGPANLYWFELTSPKNGVTLEMTLY